MELTKWDPMRDLEEFFGRYGRSMGMPRRTNQEVLATGDWAPRVDVAETEREFTINAEIPDVKKADVKVTVDNGVLSIRGERHQEKEEKDKKFHRIERAYGTFTRSFRLPDNVDETGIDAEFKNGMLKLSIPKLEEAKPKAIEVKIS